MYHFLLCHLELFTKMQFIPVYFILFSVLSFFSHVHVYFIYPCNLPVVMYTIYCSNQIEKNKDNGLFNKFLYKSQFTKLLVSKEKLY